MNVLNLPSGSDNSLLTAGTGISYNSTTQTLSNSGVLSLTGTTNQINVSGSTGDITLSFPNILNPNTTLVNYLGSSNKVWGAAYIDQLYMLRAASKISLGTTVDTTLQHDGSNFNLITTLGNTKIKSTNTALFTDASDNTRFSVAANGTITIPGLSNAGVVHNNASGVLSTSAIVDADISGSAAIANSKLAGAPTSTNTASTIVLRDANFAFSAGAITGASFSVGSISSALNTTGSDLLIQNSTTNASIINRIGSTGGNGSQFKIQDSAAANVMLVDDAGSMYVKDGIYPITASQGYVGTSSQRFGNAYLVNADIQTNLTCSGLAGSAGIAHISSAGLFSNSQIVNADIAAGAAIADSKLAQITSTGKVADSANASLAAATSANTVSTLVKRASDGAITVGNLTTEGGVSTFNSGYSTNQIVLNNTGSTTNRSNFYINNANKRDFEIGLRGSSETYVPYLYSNNAATTGRSTWVILCDTDLNLKTNGIFPLNDNAYNLGSAGSRWGTVYAATATINTSDQRAKENITNSALGLSFINTLRPVSYKFKDYTSQSVPDRDGNTTTINHTFVRTHYGLIAQEVKTVMDGLNMTTNDFAGYIYDAASDTYGLRYEEFISPLMKAVQELNARLVIAENKLTAAGL